MNENLIRNLSDSDLKIYMQNGKIICLDIF